MGAHCVNSTTYFFLPDKLPISMKMLMFFLGKCVRTAIKTMVVDRKNQKALALLYLASKPLRNAANSSGMPTEFDKANLNFSPELYAY